MSNKRRAKPFSTPTTPKAPAMPPMPGPDGVLRDQNGLPINPTTGLPAIALTPSGLPIWTEEETEKMLRLDLVQRYDAYRNACKQLVEEAYELIGLHGADPADEDLDEGLAELRDEVERRLKSAQSGLVASMRDMADEIEPGREAVVLHEPTEAERVVVEASR